MMKKKMLIALFVISIFGFSFVGVVTPMKAAQSDNIVMWTTEVEPSRLAVIEEIAARYSGTSEVTVVGIDENDLPEQIATAKAEGSLPDVMQIFYEYIGGYVADGILDADRATTVATGIADLGGLPMVVNPSTTGASDKYGAVPIDGWVQGIWYRQDLFDAEGLAAPDSYVNILAAAEALYNDTDASNVFYGIVLGTDPEAAYTQQCYEHFALANDARALDADGEVILNNANQKETLTYYTDLAAYGPPGANNWDAANQLYLTGKTAMMIYSTYIADDILGLQERDWVPIADLGNKTSAQFAIEGKHGDTATYGQLSALGIGEGAHDEAEALIEHIITVDENYLDWIHMAITGKMPLRQTVGILENWTQHEVWGSYDGLAESILDGFNNIGRWGLIDGNSYSEDIATLYSELYIPKAIADVLGGTSTVDEALEKAEKDFKDDLAPPAAPGFELAVLFSSLMAITIFVRKRR